MYYYYYYSCFFKPLKQFCDGFRGFAFYKIVMMNRQGCSCRLLFSPGAGQGHSRQNVSSSGNLGNKKGTILAILAIVPNCDNYYWGQLGTFGDNRGHLGTFGARMIAQD
jgi:hypothetical protein